MALAMLSPSLLSKLHLISFMCGFCKQKYLLPCPEKIVCHSHTSSLCCHCSQMSFVEILLPHSLSSFSWTQETTVLPFIKPFQKSFKNHSPLLLLWTAQIQQFSVDTIHIQDQKKRQIIARLFLGISLSNHFLWN